MPFQKLKDEADKQETSDLLKEEYEGACRARRTKLIHDCQDDFAEIFGNEKFAMSPEADRSVLATYKKLTIGLQWPSLDECPRDVFFRFSVVKNSAATEDLIIVDLVPDKSGKTIPQDMGSRASISTVSQLRAAISTVRNAPLSFRIVRHFHPKTTIGDQPGEKSYETFKSALGAIAAGL